MARRVTRLILGAVALWVLATWYYTWSPPKVHMENYGVVPDTSINKDIKWDKPPTRNMVMSLASLPTELPSRRIPAVQATPPKEDEDAKKMRMKRLAAVKESFVHSWNGYKKNAWLKDEVLPLTADYQNPFGGWAATLVDSLDSLWILDMKDEFETAVKACELIDFTTTETKEINVFETTIRYLGGFLAAYELSGKQHPGLLKKATEVGELLMGAFDTDNRMPVARWDWQAYLGGKPQKPSYNTLISEVGSLSMEMSKLSQLTNDMTYHDAAQRISDEIEAAQSKTKLPGMWPVSVDPSETPWRLGGDSFTLGGMSDSLYEYFPKQFLLLGGALEQPRKLYEGFIDVAKKHLFRRALNPDDIPILFSGDAYIRRNPNGRDPLIVTKPRAQHLTCFAGGMVGLAAKIFDRPADMEIAKQLTDGCVWSYFATPSGIGPEIFTFIPCGVDPAKDDCKWSERRWIDSGKQYWYSNLEPGEVTDKSITDTYKERKLPNGMVEVNDRRYILRPEAIESVFLMYRMTGDKKWADKAWKMFQAVEKHTRTRTAAAALSDVTMSHPAQEDSMESFWLAETLKYFYLVFSDFDVVSLDKWVLNTEAHPLRRADALA